MLGAGCGALLLILIWALAFHVGVFEHADQSVFIGFGGLRRPRVNSLAEFLAGLCNPQPYVYLAVVPGLVALLRRRPRVAVGVTALLLGANATTHVLKPLLAEPRAASLFAGRAPVSPVSWPSGHATAAMSLALSLVLASPGRLRPAVAALGATFAVAVSYSFLTLGWHYPSDVLGGFVVAGIWSLLVVAAISAADRRWPRTRAEEGRTDRVPLREALRPPALALAGGLCVAAVVAIARPHAVITYAQQHTAFVLGAAGIAALGLVVATAVMLAARR